MYDCKNDFGQISWRYIISSFNVFYNMQCNILQMDDMHGNSIKKKSELQMYSKKLRLLLVNKIGIDMKLIITELENQGVSEKYIEDLDLFLDKIYSIEQFWHLSELFLLGNGVDLLSEAVEWLKVLMVEYHVEQHVLHFTSLISSSQGYNEVSSHDTLRLRSLPPYSSLENSLNGSKLLLENGYWDAVYGLTFHGQLSDVWELLNIHPDIESLKYFASQKADEVDLAKQIFFEIKDVFESYPYCTCGLINNKTKEQAHMTRGLQGANLNANAAGGDECDAHSPMSYRLQVAAQSMTAWREKVAELKKLLTSDRSDRYQRQHNQSVANTYFPGSGVQFIEVLLGILSGDMHILRSCCDSWVELTLCNLLYVHNFSSTLSFSSFACIITDSMHTFEEHEKDISERNSRDMIRQLLNADVGSVIQYVLHTGDATSNDGDQADVRDEMNVAEPLNELATMLGLASAVHLLVIFNAHQGVLCLPLRSENYSFLNPNQVSGLDEGSAFISNIIIEFAGRLHKKCYPMDVVMEYLSLCPKHLACPVAIEMLMERGRSINTNTNTTLSSYYRSDKSLMEIVKQLRNPSLVPTLENGVESSWTPSGESPETLARRLLNGRGLWWEKHSNNIKAMYFYVLGRDVNRIVVLVNRYLQRITGLVTEVFLNRECMEPKVDQEQLFLVLKHVIEEFQEIVVHLQLVDVPLLVEMEVERDLAATGLSVPKRKIYSKVLENTGSIPYSLSHALLLREYCSVVDILLHIVQREDGVSNMDLDLAEGGMSGSESNADDSDPFRAEQCRSMREKYDLAISKLYTLLDRNMVPLRYITHFMELMIAISDNYDSMAVAGTFHSHPLHNTNIVHSVSNTNPLLNALEISKCMSILELHFNQHLENIPTSDSNNTNTQLTDSSHGVVSSRLLKVLLKMYAQTVLIEPTVPKRQLTGPEKQKSSNNNIESNSKSILNQLNVKAMAMDLLYV